MNGESGVQWFHGSCLEYLKWRDAGMWLFIQVEPSLDRHILPITHLDLLCAATHLAGNLGLALPEFDMSVAKILTRLSAFQVLDGQSFPWHGHTYGRFGRREALFHIGAKTEADHGTAFDPGHAIHFDQKAIG
jgi:hypothetical protein